MHQQLTLVHIPNKRIAKTDNVVTGVRTPGTLLRDAVHRVPQGDPRGDQDANNCTTVPLSLTPDNCSRFAILPSIPRDPEGSTHCLGKVKLTVWGPGSLSPLRRGYLKLEKVFRFSRRRGDDGLFFMILRRNSKGTPRGVLTALLNSSFGNG